MAKRILTDVLIQKKATPRKRKELSDGVAPGLTLRITPRGVRTWTYCWKVRALDPASGKLVAGRQQRVTLGIYPVMTLEAARQRAVEMARLVAGGGSPKGTTEATSTFGALATAFLQHHDRVSRDNTSAAIRRVLENHVLPRWQAMDLALVTPKTLNHLVNEIWQDVASKRGDAPNAGKSTAREARKWVVAAFTWGVANYPGIDVNPVAGMRRTDLKRKGQAGRELTDLDLRTIWQHSADLPVIRLLMLTGTRRNEWSEAVWSEIDATRRMLTVPASRYKTGIDFELPLVPAVWTIVESLSRTGDGLFVGGDRSVTSAVKLIQKRAPELAKWSAHDFRRTIITRLVAMGLPQDVRAAVIGHYETNDESPYNRHCFSREKREALERYAALVLKVVE